MAATCVVLFPGAAQQSTTVHPACGARACAGMQLALLCMNVERSPESGGARDRGAAPF
jgi:hypothetical protein